jgi:hypothetical protein
MNVFSEILENIQLIKNSDKKSIILYHGTGVIERGYGKRKTSEFNEVIYCLEGPSTYSNSVICRYSVKNRMLMSGKQ